MGYSPQGRKESDMTEHTQRSAGAQDGAEDAPRVNWHLQISPHS